MERYRQRLQFIASCLWIFAYFMIATEVCGQLSTLNIEFPRPADAEARARAGYPPPREIEFILHDIDELSAAVDESMAANKKAWTSEGWFRTFQLRSKRISLVSELEEAGYEEDQLSAFLTMKLRDIDYTHNQIQNLLVEGYERLWREMAEHYPNSTIADHADLLVSYRVQLHMRANGFRVAHADLPEIAEREKRLVDAGIGSDALSWALWRTDDESREEWENWMIANLPPESSGVSRLRARQALNQPIRLRGAGFENEPLDTADWAGDVVIVDFWGEWCAPCRAIHSQLAEFMRMHAERGLRVVGVLCSTDPEKAEDYLREQDTPWPQFVVHGLERPNEHPIAQRFGIDSFPTLWVIDRAGVLRHVGHRIDGEWVALVEGLLDESAPESIER